ncbi:MAG TPA: acetyl-CoA carboxylase [Candidatus Limnocylindria bacterium]|nr:acetyl-CoA carboxylase [Candidatus Limnocylindria bacterium]
MADPKRVRAEASALVEELLSRLAVSDVRALEVSRGALRVRVSKDAPAATMAVSAVPVPTAAAAAARASAAGGGVQVGSAVPAAAADAVVAPLTGVFYRSPSPQTPPFVQIGSLVASGDVIGLIEAMKLFNEIRSTKSGKVKRIAAENGQLVRARQPLIELEPS